MNGIDISHWNKGLTAAQSATAGKKYCIIKAGGADDGLYKDSCFEGFYNDFKAMGIPIGCYYFSNFNTIADAKVQAEHFKYLITGKTFEYPVYCDVETGKELTASKAILTECIKAFCQSMEAAGYYTGLYASKSRVGNNFDASLATRFTFWCAYYGKTNPNYQMWQYTSSEVISNIKVDADLCSVDFPALIKSGGFNGFGKAPAVMKEACPYKWTDKRFHNYVAKGDYDVNYQNVHYVQWYLHKLCWNIGKGVNGEADGVDGHFGSMCSLALTNFQYKHGLDADGKAGPKTREMLVQVYEAS